MTIRTAEQHDLTHLKEQTLAYLAKWKTKGGKTGGFFCPHCNCGNETTVPGKKDVSSKGYWDALTTCYECGGLFMTFRYPGGRIEAIKPD